ncbi:MAG: alkaline shock response membrane anchor protein AmaP [Candidatus Carbobacillus altaicus]|nr:alkaline shock response membrane anchor protein AmaP [Candidatus Carbobacillus altaicus]
MNAFDRLALKLYAALVLILMLAFLIIGLGLFETRVYDTISYIYQSMTAKIIVLVVDAVLLLLSLRFLWIRHRPRPVTALAGRNEYGETRIALTTFEQLASRTVQKIPGTHDVDVHFKPSEVDGYTFYIKIGVDGEQNIPQLIERIQKEVKEKVESITGVEIAQISVLVHESRQTLEAPPRRRVE